MGFDSVPVSRPWILPTGLDNLGTSDCGACRKRYSLEFHQAFRQIEFGGSNHGAPYFLVFFEGGGVAEGEAKLFGLEKATDDLA